jgi:predicted RNase H-like nuclease
MSTEVCAGIDLAWSSGWTGVALVDRDGRLVASGRVRTDDEIAGWLQSLPGRLAVVAVDAPLVVPNLSGQREPERLIGAAYGAYGASAHSSNQRLLGGPVSRALRLAQRFEWSVDPDEPTSVDPPVCVEVYPHPALVGLLRLPYRLDYKKGSTSRRLPGFRSLLAHLESIPELDLGSSSRWAEIRYGVGRSGGGGLNRWEDEVDAIVCAHLAWRWWQQPATLRVYGDLPRGYIVAPPPPTHRPERPRPTPGPGGI